LHRGQLYLSDAAPGLIARIVLPRGDSVALPKGDLEENSPLATPA
jgi:hypothetical protein